MSTSHPYISGQGNIAQMINKLRANFPTVVTSNTVKQLGLAPKNESSVINALQFLNLIDEDGKKNPDNAKPFLHQKDEDFQAGFSEIVESAYSKLFAVHGDKSWGLEISELTTFFRQTDQTSDAIGGRQAKVFQVFSSLCGKIENPTPIREKKSKSKALPSASKGTQTKTQLKKRKESVQKEKPYNEFSMAVRVEINLPSNASRETYDDIFKSIKENLIDA